MPALIIFIKNPVKGKVKTRLAATVGDDKALDIYKILLQHTRRIAMEVDVVRLLFYSDAVVLQDDWPVSHFHKHTQKGNNLGERMAHAFATAFERHKKAIIIGSDCAALTSAILEGAFAKLDSHDFVIGPATDGGYYLLGMRRWVPTLFEHIEWSTSTVFTETLKKISNMGGTYALLPTLSDVDNEADWEKAKGQIDTPPA